MKDIFNVYDHSDYRELFKAAFNSGQHQGRGKKAELAAFIGCQPTFISHVLAGRNDFNQEQVEAACRFFDLSEDATTYVLLLLNKERAGSQSLSDKYERDIQAHLKSVKQLRDLLNKDKSLSIEQQAIYYADWTVSAVHMLMLANTCKNPTDFATRLSITNEQAQNAIDFLIDAGIVKVNGNGYKTGMRNIHLDNKSPFITHHHTNMRLKAMAASKAPRPNSVHFSSFITCDKHDLDRLRHILLQALKGCTDVVNESKQVDGLAGLNIDFYEI